MSSWPGGRVAECPAWPRNLNVGILLDTIIVLDVKLLHNGAVL